MSLPIFLIYKRVIHFVCCFLKLSNSVGAFYRIINALGMRVEVVKPIY